MFDFPSKLIQREKKKKKKKDRERKEECPETTRTFKLMHHFSSVFHICPLIKSVGIKYPEQLFINPRFPPTLRKLQ